MKRTLFILILIAANIALDQITKAIVRSTLTFHESVDIVGEYFQFIWVENKGAFLGLGSDMNDTLRLVLLLILPTLVLGYVIYYIITNRHLDKLSLIAFCCIAGGGIANVYDRLVYGQVTDFLFIDLGGPFKTGIFNLADVSVTAGMIILVVASFKESKKKAATQE